MRRAIASPLKVTPKGYDKRTSAIQEGNALFNLQLLTMSGFWQRLFNLEKAVAESSPSQPAIHELIQRSEEEIADYERWKDSFILRRLVDWLADQYAIYSEKGAAVRMICRGFFQMFQSLWIHACARSQCAVISDL